MQVKDELDFIRYHVNDDQIDMLIIENQPFYRSQNSVLPGVWLPFVCVKGSSKFLDIERFAPLVRTGNYSTDLALTLLADHLSEHYIIQTEALFAPRDPTPFLLSKQYYSNCKIDLINTDIVELLDRCASPNAHQECLRISCALGGGIWNNSLTKNYILQEFFSGLIPVSYRIKDQPLFETSNPDQINQWLYAYEAHHVRNLFKFTQALAANKVDFIRYSTPHPSLGEEIRDIVVIDGLSFYRSTGHNSSLPGTWLPFICIKDDPASVDKERFVSLMDEKNYFQLMTMLFNNNLGTGYIIKINTLFTYSNERGTYQEQYSEMMRNHRVPRNNDLAKLLERCASPLFNQDCLKISCSLGGGIWNNDQIKGTVIKYFLDCNLPDLTVVNNAPLFTTDNPSKINQWLYASGAKFVDDIFNFSSKASAVSNHSNSSNNSSATNDSTKLSIDNGTSITVVSNQQNQFELVISFPDQVVCQQWYSTISALADKIGVSSFFAISSNNFSKITIQSSDKNNLGVFSQVSGAAMYSSGSVSIRFGDQQLLDFFKNTLTINSQQAFVSGTEKNGSSLTFNSQLLAACTGQTFITQLDNNSLSDYAIIISESKNKLTSTN